MAKKHRVSQNKIKKDTLVIIGNGFDIWQGLQTGYPEFRKYYYAHRDEIIKRLKIKKRRIKNDNEKMNRISDVELIYGDPFNPEELDNEFWNNFEMSLDKLDSEQINLFFGKDRTGLRKMKRSIRNANKILREAFCGWIATIAIDKREPVYEFGENCLFLNFNYTDTLQKRFHVKESDVFYVHGEASDKDSIIFGHASHPQLPEEILYRMGGRFRGLYFIEKILYETDKHVQDNILLLCMFLAMHGCMAEEIKNVYVLGHSMGLPDIEYFAFLAEATGLHDSEEYESKGAHEETCSMDDLNMRLQYAINKSGYGFGDNLIEPEQKEAVEKRFRMEQGERHREMEKAFFKLFKKEKYCTDNPIKVKPRKEDATWHISYYSERDKRWEERVMAMLECKNVRLYSSIDECLASFRTESPCRQV